MTERIVPKKFSVRYRFPKATRRISEPFEWIFMITQQRDGGRLNGAGNATEPVPPDLPLSGKPYPYNRLHPSMYLAEALGTGLLLCLGLSVVIAFWGTGAPLSQWPSSPEWRRFLNGFLFGSVGAAVAYSPLGRISGAHINPAMTLAFFLAGRLRWRDASCYVLAQIAGAVIGVACLRFWGSVGASDTWGASIPDRNLSLAWSIAGEALCTFLLVALIFFFASRPGTQPFTPLVNPPLFAVLSWLEAPLSGASANPARSFAPELISGNWSGWWVYWIGPALGTVLAVAAYRARLLGHIHLHQARLFHFGHTGGVGHRNRTR